MFAGGRRHRREGIPPCIHTLLLPWTTNPPSYRIYSSGRWIRKGRRNNMYPPFLRKHFGGYVIWGSYGGEHELSIPSIFLPVFGILNCCHIFIFQSSGLSNEFIDDGVLFGIKRFGETEIREFNMSRIGYQNIVWLQIPVEKKHTNTCKRSQIDHMACEKWSRSSKKRERGQAIHTTYSKWSKRNPHTYLWTKSNSWTASIEAASSDM